MNEELETLIEAQKCGFPGDTSDLTSIELEFVNSARQQDINRQTFRDEEFAFELERRYHYLKSTGYAKTVELQRQVYKIIDSIGGKPLCD